MKDFKSYSKQKQQEGIPQDVAEAAKQLSDVFAGKGEADVLRAIYREAEKGRTLEQKLKLLYQDIQTFAASELQKYIYQRTHRLLPIRTGSSASTPALRLATDTALGTETYAISREDNSLTICGATSPSSSRPTGGWPM